MPQSLQYVHLIGASKVLIVGSYDIKDTGITVFVFYMSTRSCCIFLSEHGLAKSATSLGPTIRHDTLLWRLNGSHVVEEHFLTWKYLPLLPELIAVLHYGHAISGNLLALWIGPQKPSTAFKLANDLGADADLYKGNISRNKREIVASYSATQSKKKTRWKDSRAQNLCRFQC